MAYTSERRVVVTGLGVVAANGIGKEAFWQATCKGSSGIKLIQRFPIDNVSIKVAGEINNFLATDYIDRKLINRTDRVTHFAFAAVQEALKDSGLTISNEDPQRIGTVIANTVGGLEYVIDQTQVLYSRGPRALSAYTAIAWLQVANVGQISIRHGVQGYSKTPINDTVSGLDAMAMAYKAIQRGTADAIITGGSEAPLHPFLLIVLAQDNHRYVNGDDPHAYRPFDRRAAGLLIAEGAGMCILEEYEHARRRGAHIYGEIVGFGQTNDALGLQIPSSNGTQYARAINMAMHKGHLSPHDIGYFSLDGRALPSSDQGEAEALGLVFGNELAQLPVTVPRTMQGHSYAASGAIDTITAFLALQHQIIPPTINCEELDPRYGLNMVHNEPQPLSASAVLLGARGIGGMNVALAVQRI
jgi:3-oxoacyl-(acyl-carrier-protein) synthase